MLGAKEKEGGKSSLVLASAPEGGWKGCPFTHLGGEKTKVVVFAQKFPNNGLSWERRLP